MEKNRILSWKQEQRRLESCRKLIVSGLYSSQEEIRREMSCVGYRKISQSSVSRMLKILGATKIQNAEGKKFYSLTGLISPDLSKPLVAMVANVECSNNFVLIHMHTGYSKAMARFIDLCFWPEILGVIAGRDVVWVAPSDISNIFFLYKKLSMLLEHSSLSTDS